MADVLVAGLSARALAQSARSAGFAPLAADFFGDLDLAEAAEANVRVAGAFDHGFGGDALMAALERLAAERAPIGIVCGTGFEDRPELLTRLAQRWPLLGNSAEQVARVKDPAELAAGCGRLGIPHPKWSDAGRGDDWFSKRAGGSGGSHIRSSAQPDASSDPSPSPSPQGGGQRPRTYWQERVAGTPVSALVLGSGDKALVLGFSEQWADPLPEAPFRYGGAVRPAGLADAVQVELAGAAQRIAEEFGLLGLNSVDFLVAPEGWNLIEINPRPGATLDIFQPEGESLFRFHVDACRGRLPPQKPGFSRAAAARIVYARRGLRSVPRMSWPEWAADRQPPGSRVDAGAPLCTVLARAQTADRARTSAEARAEAIRSALEDR